MSHPGGGRYGVVAGRRFWRDPDRRSGRLGPQAMGIQSICFPETSHFYGVWSDGPLDSLLSVSCIPHDPKTYQVVYT